MTTLYSHLICPKSRFVSIILRETEIEFVKEKIEYWKERKKIESIDPLGEIPILKTNSNHVLSSVYAILEYVMDLSQNSHLIPESLDERAEMRRIIYWILSRFEKEVTNYFLNEKFIRLTSLTGAPKTEFLRAARINLYHHTTYFQELMSRNGFLSSKNLSFADLLLASEISVLDYFGEVNWDKLKWLKEWYAPIKSRPSFREILSDRLSIISPPSYYEDPDF